ncbi:MAG: tetratricopeptide repeat protein, partial [Bacteroidota bacterium]
MNCSKTYPSFLIAFFLLYGFAANAQSSNQQEKTAWQKKGRELLTQGNQLTQVDVDSSLYLKEQAVSYFKKAEDWEAYVEALNTLTYVYYYKQDFESLNHYAQLAVNMAKKHQLPQASKPHIEAINNLSILALQRNDYVLAEEMFFQSIATQQQLNPDKFTLATLYYNMGTVKLKKGDIDESIYYYEQALELRLDTLGEIHPEVARNFLAIGNCYKDKKYWNSALEYQQKASRILQHPSIAENLSSKRIQINCYQNIAETYVHLERMDKAFQYLQKALSLQPNDQSYRKSLTYEMLGKAYQKKGTLKEAVDHFTEAKRLSLIEYRAYKQHAVFAQRSQYLANALLAQERETEALQQFQQALKEISHEFSSPNVHENPTLKDLFSKNDALDILSGKAKASYREYLKDKSQLNYLETAFQTYELATQVIHFLRGDGASLGTKYFLADQSLSIYEAAIQLAIELNERKKDTHYLVAALRFAENNKAIALQESMRDKLAKTFSGIPDSLLRLEKRLKVDLTFYEKEVSKAKRQNKEMERKRLKQLEQSQFNAKEAYKKLVRAFEKNYPKYYQLKYGVNPIDVSALQNQLSPNSLLIEYFVGEQQIYIFGLSQNEIQVKRLANDSTLLQQVKQLRAFVSQPPPAENSNDLQAAFYQRAHQLYQKLIAVVDHQTHQQLLIIPDDFLSYLPFDVLLTKDPRHLSDPRQIHRAYLLQDRSISYHYSAAFLLDEKRSHQKGTIPFAGFAPSFQDGPIAEQRMCRANQLYHLNCSQSEVREINQLMNGEMLSAEGATKSFFEQN